MFAVPGWSVSADKLKSEFAAPQSTASDGPKRSKKRKRHNDEENVTSENVADLWHKIIEGQNGDTKKKKKHADKANADDDSGQPRRSQADKGDENGKFPNGSKEVARESKSKKRKDKKDKKERRMDKAGGDNQAMSEGQRPTTTSSKPDKGMAPTTDAVQKPTKAPAPLQSVTQPATAPTGADVRESTKKPQQLTALQQAMRSKLAAGRFRLLNEALYTRPSEEAARLFAQDPEAFERYHDGFRTQVASWPENPIDGFIADIRRRAMLGRGGDRKGNGKKHRGSAAAAGEDGREGQTALSSIHRQPLPRNPHTKQTTIADLGCGDAKLARSLRPDVRQLGLSILSFDLQAPSSLTSGKDDEENLVTAADIANLPLPDGSVDVAVLCLALMGTNWPEFVEEAWRVLRWRGELWVAEIQSRFAGAAARRQPPAHSVGQKRKAGGKAGNREGGGGDDVDDAAMDVLDAEDYADGVKKKTTDVSAFVRVLQSRGFVLAKGDDGRDAIDLRNKMFVKMHFVKAHMPTKGRYIDRNKGARGQSQRHGVTVQVGTRKDFKTAGAWNGQGADDEDGIDDASVLKPCVYKIR